MEQVHHHYHHHRQPWAKCPLVSDAIVTIAAHRCLSRATWLNSCRLNSTPLLNVIWPFSVRPSSFVWTIHHSEHKGLYFSAVVHSADMEQVLWRLIPDDAITGSSANDAVRHWHDGINWHWVSRKPVTDVAPLTPVENVQHTLLSSTHHLCTILNNRRPHTKQLGLRLWWGFGPKSQCNSRLKTKVLPKFGLRLTSETKVSAKLDLTQCQLHSANS